MRIGVLIGALAVVAISVLALLGTGSDSDTSSQAVAPPPETTDPVPPLPPGWTKSANPRLGVAVGVPPGWSAKAGAARTTLREPAGLAVASVSADRSEGAVEGDLQDFADDVAGQLAGGRPVEDLEAPEAGPGYESAGALVPKAEDGRRIEVIVVRRPELAAYPMLVASAANVRAADLDPLVSQIVGSLRGRPVSAG